MPDEMSENKARSLRGELYYAFSPEMAKERYRCHAAVERYNNAGDVSRRKRVELWRGISGDPTQLPPQTAGTTEDEDEAQFTHDPIIEPPFHCDYGTNILLGSGVYINFNCTILDTCRVSIGARTLFGPNVQLYSATHPLDPEVRRGTEGPEMGGQITVGEDCWIGGSVVVLPGITVGKGAVVGAGSVVTKDVAPYTIVAGNPARKLRDVPRGTKAEVTSGALAALERDQAREKSLRP
ncbi:hypothetical protein LTR62_007848 [Meristemomyces frigidus]|uniref:Maltose/galactoside acetyltransferase domain-containing protein n=1 Tax=Meristemomyces frigidus TaxID=1508187 RepID=A0AAN7YHK0_9PEZI|nr:hypothetical protein LTR62_007848 [Meristemomyces frigidus]